jgi:hypothetical protein
VISRSFPARIRRIASFRGAFLAKAVRDSAAL